LDDGERKSASRGLKVGKGSLSFKHIASDVELAELGTIHSVSDFSNERLFAKFSGTNPKGGCS
jgi:hypothetical protein